MTKRKESDSRLRALSVAIIIFALVLAAKLYFVQIVSGATFKQKADHQYVAGANFFDRGSIYFTSKDGTHVPAATVETGYILAISPSQIAKSASTSAQSIYTALAAVTPLDHADFTAKAAKVTDPYEELAHRLPSGVADQIAALKLPGVNEYKEDWRVYPGNSMAAHTVGFIGYGSGGTALSGQSGLERYYESVLKRSPSDAFVNFFAEVFSDLKKSVSKDDSLEGDVVTTIEPSVQSYLEDQLQKVQDQYQSEFTGGIVMDPQTGEIYAMALNPTFDPNSPQSAGSGDVFQNKLVEDRYEMGSIVKSLTMASGLDSGVITPQSTYDDPGCETLNKKTFCNYDLRSRGAHVPMQTILNDSLNTGAAYVALKVGQSNFKNYLLDYGFGSTTGIDLPSEGRSLISNLDTGRDLEYAEASFGQGIALTPVQTIRALATLGNGGYLVTPHLVKEIDYKIGTKKVTPIDKIGPIFKPTTSPAISKMLTEVVDTALKNGQVRLDNYSMAAKTGTAQIAKPGGGYYSDHYVHSFFGYFPSYNPRFIVFLYTYYPKGVQYASETLTDSFINMAKFLINYYEIPPDRTAPPPATVPKL